MFGMGLLYPGRHPLHRKPRQMPHNDLSRRALLAAGAFGLAMAQVHQKAVDEPLLVFVVHDANPHALGRNVRGYTQAQHWFQDLTTLS
ncbi:MAG: twin-arginine translocation signal protein [Rhodospirillales bacterium]|jgi:hypothetical protein|nr:twin-arginine translocation signal protein [Rhodospirillales bacterium]